MTIYENINRLVSYGLKTKLFPKEDRIFIQNKLLELFITPIAINSYQIALIVCVHAC